MQVLHGKYRLVYYTHNDTRYVDVWTRGFPKLLEITTYSHWKYLLRKHGGVVQAADALFEETKSAL